MRHNATTEQIDTLPAAEDEAAATTRRSSFRPSRAALALLACILLALAWLLAPTLRWAYDIERAGRLMDQGLAWPTPRLATSLPTARDEQALDRALMYLDDAARRRPEHPQAYRLAGQIYAALADWERSAIAFDRARAVAPRNPLYAWEASLIYDQMQRVVEQAPHESLMDALAAGHLIAPGQLVR